MNKKHSTPEFTVIKQSQANAKFFVASEGSGGAPFQGVAPTPTSGTAPTNSASNYDDGGDINM